MADITVNIKEQDTVTVVNNVLNINSADTLAVVNNVLNINSTDTLAWVLNVANIPNDTISHVVGLEAIVRDIIGDSLSGLVYGVSELQAFFGACDECYYRLFPEGGTANKDSAIVIDGSINTSDSLLGKIVYKHGTVNAVYDTAFFYTRPWW